MLEMGVFFGKVRSLDEAKRNPGLRLKFPWITLLLSDRLPSEGKA